MWFEGSRRKMKCKTHFGFFDHRRFLVDQLWPDSSRDPVVKNASYLIFIAVQTLNCRAVDISDQFYIRLSRNLMVELSWSVEFKILGTIKRYKSFLYNLIFWKRKLIRLEVFIYRTLSTDWYGSQNLKFYWPTQFNHLVSTQPNVELIWHIDGSIV